MYLKKHGDSPAPHHFGQHAPTTGIRITLTNLQQYPSEKYMRPDVKVPWSSGLCCITCWCPCITFGQIADIVGQGSTSCGASGALYAILGWCTGYACNCIYSCYYRTRLRNQYMLEERPCGDCCVHFCCETCALRQEYRELKNRGFDMSLGWHGNMERQTTLGVPVPTAPVVETGMQN